MIGLLLTLILVGVALYLIDRLIPMDPTIKTILRIVVILAVILYVMAAFGLLARLDVPLRY